MSDPVRSTCPYCGVGCGVMLSPDGPSRLQVAGDTAHPANLGRLCSKGLALGDTVDLTGRLLQPQVDGAPADWDGTLQLVADKFRAAIDQYGPDSVAFYVSGQLLTEDYYVANKLMKGFIGSANIDTNSRLCMASTVAGHKRAFGTDTVPQTYEDLELADLVVLTGSNLAWCHPVLYQRLAAARAERGTKIVVIDPRRTATCDIADLHLKIAPGGDVALFNGLLAHLSEVGAVDAAFVADHTNGFADTLAAARADDLTATGLVPDELEAFFTLFAKTERVVTVFSQGVNQSTQGADKVNAILNCHLATGRIGTPGCGPLSATGQPNAMGGRETGGLANMLAAHLDLENPAHRAAVQDFWAAPNVAEAPGLKAVDMFRAVGEGKIKALWIACTNPAVSMPEADAVARAIEGCDFVVVSDLFADTDTAKLADVVLPALGWGEKDGTVTNSDRVISRQRAVLPGPGTARADWDIFAEVGRRMGWHDAFDYQSPAEVFREHAALSRIAGAMGRDFDISALADLSDAEYDALDPVRWPVTATRTGGRFFADGQFFTPDGRANLRPVRQGGFGEETTEEHPFRLNTGRVRDQWHTMTRTARTSRLTRHLAEPFLQIHPMDAARTGLHPADLAQVSNAHGSAILRVLVSTDATEGAPFAPIHWTAQTAPAARIDALVTGLTDPISGQPESKAAPVAIARFAAGWYGFAVSEQAFAPRADYWAQVRSDTGWRAELAGLDVPEDWTGFAQDLFGTTTHPTTVTDPARQQTRLAFFDGDRLVAALFVAPAPVEVARDFVTGLVGQPAPGILAARASADLPDPGPTICACMNVGRNQILSAIAADGAATLDTICTATGVGTNCGSCRPEVADLIARTRLPQAAE